MDFTNTNSYKNVKSSFANESQALVKYTFYAEVAREEGREDIALLFDKMGQNEREHAKIWFKLLNDGLDNSQENLKGSAESENFEWKHMYPKFAEEARKEGLESLAIRFEQIASIECDHERKFFEASLPPSEQKNSLPPTESTGTANFYCLFCGHSENTPLPTCPVCGAEKSFSE